MSQLSEVFQALMDPKVYPGNPEKVELMQTQMSFVFLADDYVYKVKKPVDLGYLDYTTLEKRQFYCQREVELNRRLCPDAYLGVEPITRNKGLISLGGRGKIVEYAVLCFLSIKILLISTFLSLKTFFISKPVKSLPILV